MARLLCLSFLAAAPPFLLLAPPFRPLQEQRDSHDATDARDVRGSADRAEAVALSRQPDAPTVSSFPTSASNLEPTEDNRSVPRCWLYNEKPCPNGEGVGGMFRRIEFIIALAEKYGCAYVCNPQDWETGGHATGNVGSLFGCRKDGVVGDAKRIASRKAIGRVRSATVRVEYDKSRSVRLKGGKPLLRSSAWYIRRSLADGVYKLQCPGVQTVTHETTWQWIQGQFDAVRLAEGRSAAFWGSATFRIAIQMRRGDRPEACPLYLYLNALRFVFGALPGVTSRNTKLLIIGEVDPASPEFACLRRFGGAVDFLAGRAILGKGSQGYESLRRDLDHIAGSNVLILGGGGSFPSLAALVQRTDAGQVILHSRTKDSALDGLPQAVVLDVHGRAECGAELKLKGLGDAEVLPTGEGQMSKHLELAIQDYSAWFQVANPCQNKVARDGFDGKSWKCALPNFTKPLPCMQDSPASPVQPQSTLESAAAASLYPLDKRYLACTRPCDRACLAMPGDLPGKCGRMGCCKPWGTYRNFTSIPHKHVALYQSRCAGNINHDFHQNFWPLYWWTAVYDDAAILVDRKQDRPASDCAGANYWTDQIFWRVAKLKNWTVYNFSRETHYCFTGQLHVMESVGPCCDYALRPMPLLRLGKRDLWSAVLQREPQVQDPGGGVVLYTRGRSSWRRIRDPQKLEPLFRGKVQILDDVPKTLVAQAQLFASAGLLLAPNGGWAPNAVFMGSDACLVELHQYKMDSWIVMFGLAKTLAEVLLVVGDYRDPKAQKIVRRGRVGGDDDFLVTGARNNLYTDIFRAMASSRVCAKFLAKKACLLDRFLILGKGSRTLLVDLGVLLIVETCSRIRQQSCSVVQLRLMFCFGSRKEASGEASRSRKEIRLVLR
ncbi:unnamed protein product [Effrenium voratum]|nr:unnamed protein product [Effrenium voratum]